MNSSDQIQAERDGELWAESLDAKIWRDIKTFEAILSSTSEYAETTPGRPIVKRYRADLAMASAQLIRLLREMSR